MCFYASADMKYHYFVRLLFKFTKFHIDHIQNNLSVRYVKLKSQQNSLGVFSSLPSPP